MTLNEMKAGESALITAVGGRGRAQMQIARYGAHSANPCDASKGRADGRSDRDNGARL